MAALWLPTLLLVKPSLHSMVICLTQTLVSLFETYHRIVVRNLLYIYLCRFHEASDIQKHQVAWEASSAPHLTVIHHLLVVKYSNINRG
jgi:hypothetical protein